MHLVCLLRRSRLRRIIALVEESLAGGAVCRICHSSGCGAGLFGKWEREGAKQGALVRLLETEMKRLDRLCAPVHG